MSNRLASTALVFVSACALIIIVGLARSPHLAPEARDESLARAVKGLKALHNAQRALAEQNYGELSAHLADTQDAFTWMFNELHGTDVDDEKGDN